MISSSTVRSRYFAVTFIHITLERHPFFARWGELWGVGVLGWMGLWVSFVNSKSNLSFTFDIVACAGCDINIVLYCTAIYRESIVLSLFLGWWHIRTTSANLQLHRERTSVFYPMCTFICLLNLIRKITGHTLYIWTVLRRNGSSYMCLKVARSDKKDVTPLTFLAFGGRILGLRPFLLL